MDSGNSGISVIESPPRGQDIPASRECVAAFIGPAPRGPINIPVAIRSLEEFLTRFAVPGYLSRMEFLLYQFFENGGTLAIVVRVCRTRERNFISLPGALGDLQLEALNPGPLEYLRASVDYQGIGPGEPQRFNLVVHRCRSPAHPLVEEQETYSAITVDPRGPDFIGNALAASSLVRLRDSAPPQRPDRTISADAAQPVRYVYSRPVSQADNTPTDYDLIGSREENSGLFALEQVPWVDFICLVPGVSGASLGPVALFAAERYCRERYAMLILDPPASWSSVEDVVRSQRQRGFASPNALTYFPALENPPHAAVGGHLSAAGALTGLLCAVGLGRHGRSTLALGRTRPALALDEAEVYQLERLGVNPLMRSAPSRIELGELVTLARSGGMSASWNSLRQRRVALFILSSVTRHTRWAAFDAPSPALWQEVRDQVAAFLEQLHARGVLAGEQSHEAWYVKCDVDTNGRQSAGPPGVVLIVGVALARAGEFIAFQISHTMAECRVAEIGWQPGLALAS